MKKITSLEYNTLSWFLIKTCFPELTLTILLYRIKQDAWISVLLGSIIGLIPFFLFEYLKNKYPNDDMITLNNKLWKNPIIINTLIIIGSFIIVTCTFWILIHFAKALFLYKTSLWITSLAFIIPITYAATKEINIISKVSLMLFYISILFSIIIIVNLKGNIDISNIKPIFESNINNIANNTLFFLGINISKMFYLSIIPKNKITNYSFKKNLLFYLFTCANLIDIALTTICVFGIDLSILYEYPAFQILKRVNILGIFDRIESLLSIEALFSLFINITLIIYYIKETIQKTFKLNKKTNKYIVIFICCILFLITNYLFITYKSSEIFFKGPLIYISFFILFIIPTITFIKSLNNIKNV